MSGRVVAQEDFGAVEVFARVDIEERIDPVWPCWLRREVDLACWQVFKDGMDGPPSRAEGCLDFSLRLEGPVGNRWMKTPIRCCDDDAAWIGCGGLTKPRGKVRRQEGGVGWHGEEARHGRRAAVQIGQSREQTGQWSRARSVQIGQDAVCERLKAVEVGVGADQEWTGLRGQARCDMGDQRATGKQEQGLVGPAKAPTLTARQDKARRLNGREGALYLAQASPSP